MKINIIKAEGTKNHFLIIKKEIKPNSLEKFLKKVIEKTNYDRIDGFLWISKSREADFKMDYYNNDGSWETMCANGARCAALFMYQQKLVKKNKMTIETGDGYHYAEILKHNFVKISMNSPKYKTGCIKINGIEGRHIDSGASHFVIQYKNISKEKAKSLGELIRNNKVFSPRGTNVNFYEDINENNIKVRTYEKGIEDIVFSCGTGSLACVYHLSKANKIISPTVVDVDGGKLEINFSQDWKKITLSGEAKIEDAKEIEIY